MKNFTISLYAFHLRQTLTDAPDQVTSDAKCLWENLVKVGETLLPFPGLKDLRSKLICYEKGEYNPQLELGRTTESLIDSDSILDLGSISTEAGFRIKSNFRPFLLNDTYAVDFTLFPESPEIQIDVPQLKHFQPSCLRPNSIEASLGQTLWLYGEVNKSDEECQVLAEQYAVALLAGTSLNPVLVNKSSLFGSLLFEFQANDPKEPQNLAKQCHILVSINNLQADTPNLIEEANEWLLNLLCCRHKIFYIYQQARDRYPKARAIYSKLDKDMQSFPQLITHADSKIKLEQLKELLTAMPKDGVDYGLCLRDLKAHHTSITTNIINYGICLEKIIEIGKNNEINDSLKFWENFFNRTSKQWQTQIQIDIDYLSPGQDLFGRMIDTIRGIVAIEQAESERANQIILHDQEKANKARAHYLAVGGFGLGSATLVTSASILSAQGAPHVRAIEEIFAGNFKLNKDYGERHTYLADAAFALSFSIITGVIFGFAAWKIIQHSQPPTKKES